MFGENPKFTDFHEFGSDVYAMVPYERRRKLDDKAVKMKFIGYDEASKGWRLVNQNLKIHVSREVKFLDTNQRVKRQTGSAQMDSYEEADYYWKGSENIIEQEDDFQLLEQEENQLLAEPEEFFDAEFENEEGAIEEEHQAEVQPQPIRHSTRENFGQRPSRFDDYVVYQAEAAKSIDKFEPRSYKEAMDSKSAEHWEKAMKEELDSIEENKTWELIDLPHGRKAVGSKWVYKIKRDENGKIVRYKARLVAQGFSQKFGIDYDEVFAPVARSTTLRLLLSVAGKRNYVVRHYDIKTAFLNGKLEEEVYLKQPLGFQKGNKVYRLKKSLYGLKQAARVWNQTLHEALVTNGCIQNQTDRCLYIWKNNDKVCYILVHVDDLLAAGSDEQVINQIMEALGRRFETKNLGEAKHYLGIDIERDNNGRFLISQRLYIDKIVEEAGLTEAKISKFPLDTGYNKQEGSLLESNAEYRKLIGMLLYLTTNSRPDIAASVAILSKKVEKPRDNDLNEVKRIIRYLKGTRNMKLSLNEANGKEVIHAYSDANWAEDREDRKSNSGYFCSFNGGAISWCSRKQDVIALSSAEAEYVALTEACKEVTWLKEVSKGFDVEISEPVTILTDSQSCISMIKNQHFSNRTKHIDTKYHYIRNQVTEGKIKLEYCPTADNAADIFTKPLGSIKIDYLRKLIGLRHSQVEEEC
jgi:hypothetical protein